MKQPTSPVNSFDDFQTSSYFNALDGLRAVSILLVLLHHVPRYPASHVLHTLQENGRYGVSFFFVISGFLICTLFLREERRTGRIDLWKFYGRRALRLLPLYYVVLCLQALLVFGLKQYTPENHALFVEKLPSYLFYYSNLLATATQGPFFCSWSLAVEEQFYLVFGLLLFFASRRVVVGAALAALICKPVVFATCGNVDVDSALWRVIFSYQEPILFGVLAAFVLNTRPGYELLARYLGQAWMPACLGMAITLWVGAHPMQTQSSWDAQLLYLLMTLTLAALVIQPGTPVVCSRFMIHIGRISYGIYLLHMFVVSLVKKLPGGTSPVMCFLLSASVVIIAASLVYRHFEHPIIAYYKKRLSPDGGVSVVALPVKEPSGLTAAV